ncbi:MAG: SDR family NAD(P)-dependent oxidoreductase [Paenibacillaceae bacterium]|nr:SDR family NAD(P)-dependent oxidoreductase [Paenibacillaceae bacterium]
MAGQRGVAGLVVVVTGASSGIGAALCRELDRLGATTVLLARSESKLREVAAGLRGDHAAYVVDVASAEQVQDGVRQTLERFGRIDAWVNNAGFGEFERVEAASLASFEAMMDVNYMGVVRCTKAALPAMRQAGRGTIVNVVSLAGKLATAKSAGYAASKHAALGFSNALRRELKGSGIAVAVVNPGPVDTPFFDRADPGGGYAQRVRPYMLRPERVVRAIVGAITSGRGGEVDLPRTAGVGARLFQLFPRVSEWLFGRFLDKK